MQRLNSSVNISQLQHVIGLKCYILTLPLSTFTYLIGPFWRYFWGFGVIRAGVVRADVKKAKNIQFWRKSGVNFFSLFFVNLRLELTLEVSVIIKGGDWKQWIDDITYRLNSFAFVIWTIALGESPIWQKHEQWCYWTWLRY